MRLDRGTQKQIAQRFKGNLDYFKKPHYWRRLRFLTILLVTLGGVAAMTVYYFLGPETFYNAGPISRSHAHFANDCQKCHEPHGTTWTIKTADSSALDAACQKCHAGHAFHEPNVARDHSCTACHHEHLGHGPMPPPSDANCRSCHNTPHEMAAAIDKGKTISAAAFNFRPDRGLVVFHAPRPAEGYTKIFPGFADGHPDFRVHADKLRDPDTLKFNHKKHLTDTNNIPLLNGRRLACADCHQPAPTGEYFQKPNFDKNCQACHSLQFDERNPALHIPHGDSEHVHAFLRSLPAQYADFARREKKIFARPELDSFVDQQMKQLREQALTGELLEEQIFFSAGRTAPAPKIGGQGATGRAKFPGCAYCHEVKAVANAAPVVTPPVIIERWLPRGQFHHAKHANVDCLKCHAALGSTDTADILLPHQTSCTECHSPKGGVAHNCSECHNYHAPTRR